jgi:hypothetical protein
MQISCHRIICHLEQERGCVFEEEFVFAVGQFWNRNAFVRIDSHTSNVIYQSKCVYMNVANHPFHSLEKANRFPFLQCLVFFCRDKMRKALIIKSFFFFFLSLSYFLIIQRPYTFCFHFELHSTIIIINQSKWNSPRRILKH